MIDLSCLHPACAWCESRATHGLLCERHERRRLQRLDFERTVRELREARQVEAQAA